MIVPSIRPGLCPEPRGGFAPATPKTKTKPSYEGKNKAHTSLPLVGPRAFRSKDDRNNLPRCAGAVEQTCVLAVAPLAGFEVIIDGRF